MNIVKNFTIFRNYSVWLRLSVALWMRSISPTLLSVLTAALVVLALLIARSTGPSGASAAELKSALKLPPPPRRIPDAAVRAQTCLECHDEMVDLLVGDKHIAKDFHCVVCHGTSQAHLDMEEEGTLPDRVWRRWVEEENRYQWRVKNASIQIARFCASCHTSHPAPEQKIQQKQEIKTISWKHYLDSSHGLAVSEGSHDAPTCTDCHYAHGAGAEPMTGQTVVRRCALCHADRGLMERTGLDPDVLDDFEAGTHAGMATASAKEKSSCVPCHDPH